MIESNSVIGTIARGLAHILTPLGLLGLTACAGEELTSNGSLGFADSISDADWAHGRIENIVYEASEHPAFEAALDTLPETASPDELTILAQALVLGVAGNPDPLGARQLYQLACDAGQMRACSSLGQMEINSKDPRSFARGIERSASACNAGISWACQNLSDVYASGRGTDVNAERASRYAEKACRDAHMDPCVYGATHIVDLKPATSKRLLKEACQANNLMGCYNLGHHYMSGKHGPNEDEKAAHYFGKACQSGAREPCQNLLIMIWNGRANVQADLQRLAVYQSTRLCELGDKEVCHSLAMHYGSTKRSGLKYDPEKTYKFAKLACEFGHRHDCGWVATMYQKGNGVERDLQAAADMFLWLCSTADTSKCLKAAEVEAIIATGEEEPPRAPIIQRTCELGDGGACRTLAWSYATGERTEKDLDRALELFRMGCDHRDPKSCMDLGAIHAFSLHGTPEDKMLARDMYKRACDMELVLGCEEYEKSLASEG
ncbi:MAG: tetratricopeptide repeat protein [Henriciella sp.]|nr:tetratricopeptide repeat protein [Henriciella sp.]